jgi:hypothetical protein
MEAEEPPRERRVIRAEVAEIRQSFGAPPPVGLASWQEWIDAPPPPPDTRGWEQQELFG